MLGTRMADHRFIIVDDHPLFRGALGQALSAAFANSEVLEAGSLDELTDRLAMAGEIDLILLDLSMPGVHGVSGLLYLRAQHPEVPVVIVSASADAATIRREIGLPPDVDLSCAAAGGESAELVSRLSTLTPQQVRVLMMLGEGLL